MKTSITGKDLLTMVNSASKIIRWADAIKGRRVKVDGPQCGGLYKEDN